MESRYIDGAAVPAYDEKVTQVLADEFPDADDPENWLAGGFLDGYRLGIETPDGRVYREFGVSMNEGDDLHRRLHDLGFRDQVGELEGSRRGYHWLLRPPAEI